MSLKTSFYYFTKQFYFIKDLHWKKVIEVLIEKIFIFAGIGQGQLDDGDVGLGGEGRNGRLLIFMILGRIDGCRGGRTCSGVGFARLAMEAGIEGGLLGYFLIGLGLSTVSCCSRSFATVGETCTAVDLC